MHSSALLEKKNFIISFKKAKSLQMIAPQKTLLVLESTNPACETNSLTSALLPPTILAPFWNQPQSQFEFVGATAFKVH